MVSSLLENETVDLQALEMVCDHVMNSNGRASCIYQEVPLEFVCSPVTSHGKFIEVRTPFWILWQVRISLYIGIILINRNWRSSRCVRTTFKEPGTTISSQERTARCHGVRPVQSIRRYVVRLYNLEILFGKQNCIPCFLFWSIWWSAWRTKPGRQSTNFRPWTWVFMKLIFLKLSYCTDIRDFISSLVSCPKHVVLRLASCPESRTNRRWSNWNTTLGRRHER